MRGNSLTFHDQKITKLHKHPAATPDMPRATDSPEAAMDKQLVSILQNRTSESYRILTFTPDLFTLTNAANPPLMGMACQRIKK